MLKTFPITQNSQMIKLKIFAKSDKNFRPKFSQVIPKNLYFRKKLEKNRIFFENGMRGISVGSITTEWNVF